MYGTGGGKQRGGGELNSPKVGPPLSMAHSVCAWMDDVLDKKTRVNKLHSKANLIFIIKPPPSKV